jgi:hypothetical protein
VLVAVIVVVVISVGVSVDVGTGVCEDLVAVGVRVSGGDVLTSGVGDDLNVIVKGGCNSSGEFVTNIWCSCWDPVSLRSFPK